MPSEEEHVEDALRRATEWQTQPPIRIIEPGSALHGAIRCGSDTRTEQPMHAYTEITGYAISVLDFLRRERDDTRHLDAQRDAAEFLLRIQSPERAYADERRLYAFDTAVCIVGMARFSRSSGDRRYLESAIAAGGWLLGMQRTDGSFRMMAEQGGGPVASPGVFGDGSCVHAKNAIALLELHAATGEARFLDATRRVCSYTLSLQDTDGSFWSSARHDCVFTHAHAYACEGLIYVGNVMGDAKVTGAAVRGIGWLRARQSADGSWRSQYRSSRWSRRRAADLLRDPRPCDAVAQAARLFRLAGEEYEEPRRRALRFLLRCQSPDGGFPSCKTRFGQSPLHYTWSAQFAAQALAWNSAPARVSDLF